MNLHRHNKQMGSGLLSVIIFSAIIFSLLSVATARFSLTAQEVGKDRSTIQQNHIREASARYFAHSSYCENLNFFKSMPAKISGLAAGEKRILWEGDSIAGAENSFDDLVIPTFKFEDKVERLANMVEQLSSPVTLASGVSRVSARLLGKDLDLTTNKINISHIYTFILELDNAGSPVSCYDSTSSRNICVSIGGTYDESRKTVCS